MGSNLSMYGFNLSLYGSKSQLVWVKSQLAWVKRQLVWVNLSSHELNLILWGFKSQLAWVQISSCVGSNLSSHELHLISRKLSIEVKFFTPCFICFDDVYGERFSCWFRRHLQETSHGVNSDSQIDRMSRVLFPSCFTAILIFYWRAYTTWKKHF